MNRQTTVADAAHSHHEAAHKGLAWAAALVPIVACCAIISAKFLLIWRININWDEFFFLSHVHELRAGSLTLLLQGAYTHLFRWLTYIPGNEVDQIIAARIAMFGPFVATLILIWRLACKWASPGAALLAPLCYLAMSPVLKHGASFRSDSLMAPLTVLTLLLLADPEFKRRNIVLAAISLGATVAVSVKAILLAPAIAALLLLTCFNHKPFPARKLALDVLLLGLLSTLTAAALLTLHKLALAAPVATTSQAAAATANKVLFNVPFFPQADFFYATWEIDNFSWMLLLAGAVIAAFQRWRRPALACALALTPVLFYRNAFPYYYAVMLAPACVLAAVPGDALREFLRQRAHPMGAVLVTSAVAVAMFAHGSLQLLELRHDEQADQRLVVATVHQIFPRAVPYLDTSGMMASFPKVNFFMSSWGVEEYRARRRGFVAEALHAHRPPLLLSNRPILNPNADAFHLLLPEDQELIKRFYLPYWGPVMVAGAAFEVSDSTDVSLSLPFSGSYRLETSHPLLVDGVLRQSGDSIDVAGASVHIRAALETGAAIAGRFVVSSAQPAPPRHPTPLVIYTGL
jgi:hypothetical protein